jgi:hypothetical protein
MSLLQRIQGDVMALDSDSVGAGVLYNYIKVSMLQVEANG